MGLTDATYGDGVLAVPIGATLAAHRLFRFAGAPPSASLAGLGLDADGVTWRTHQGLDTNGLPVTRNPDDGFLATPGLPVKVEAGAAFASGATLQSDSVGRAITKTTGIGVLRALQAASAAGDVVWAVWTSGR